MAAINDEAEAREYGRGEDRAGIGEKQPVDQKPTSGSVAGFAVAGAGGRHVERTRGRACAPSLVGGVADAAAGAPTPTAVGTAVEDSAAGKASTRVTSTPRWSGSEAGTGETAGPGGVEVSSC